MGVTLGSPFMDYPALNVMVTKGDTGSVAFLKTLTERKAPFTRRNFRYSGWSGLPPSWISLGRSDSCKIIQGTDSC